MLKELLQRNQASLNGFGDILNSFTPKRKLWYAKNKYRILQDCYAFSGGKFVQHNGKGGGKTTRMLDEAISMATCGNEVMIVAHTVHYARQLKSRIQDAPAPIAPSTIKRMKFVSARQSDKLRGFRGTTFVDHYAWEALAGERMMRDVEDHINREVHRVYFQRSPFMNKEQYYGTV